MHRIPLLNDQGVSLRTGVLTAGIVMAFSTVAATQTAPSRPRPPAALLAVSAAQDGAGSVTLYQARGWSVGQPKTIAVGQRPTEMCFSPDKARLYVSDPPSKSVIAIDLKTQTVVGTLTDPNMKAPDGCVVSPDSKKLYSIDQSTNAVFVFDTQSKAVLKQVPVGQNPRRGAFDREGRRLVVSNGHSNSLSVIDTATDTVVQTVTTPGREPRGLAWSPDGKYLVVLIISDDSVEFFKGDTLEFDQQVAAAVSSQRAIFSRDGQFLYVVGRFELLHVLDLRDSPPPPGRRRQIMTLPVPKWAWDMTTDPDVDYLYITQIAEDNQIVVMDTRVLKTVNSLTGPKGQFGAIYIPQ